jgi:uncharacterized delta-60 repeat protein
LPLKRQGSWRDRADKHKFRPHLEPLERRELPTAGFLDQGFGIHGKVDQPMEMSGAAVPMDVCGVALQSDGKIVVAGTVTTSDQTRYFGLMRFNSDGTLDSGFGNHGLDAFAFAGNDVASSLVIEPDDKIVVAGYFLSLGMSSFEVARYTKNGAPDSSFGNGAGYVTTDFHNIGGVGDANANSVALQPNGKIVAAGDFTNATGNSYFALARYNSDGSLDATFGSGVFLDGLFLRSGETLTDFPIGGPTGVSEAGAHAVAIQSDGRIVAAGGAYVQSAQQGV